MNFAHTKSYSIIQYWDTTIIPTEITDLMNSWKSMNSEHNYKIFNYESADEFIREKYGLDVAILFRMAALPAMQSDIFRVAYTLSEGGIYLDAATRCLIPISEWPFINLNSCRLMRKWHGGIWNGFISCEPNVLFMSKIFSEILLNVKQKKSNNVWLVTGPGVFNKAMSCQKYDLLILDQKTCSNYFSLVNDLKHKKTNHWSDMQNTKSIFR